MFVRHGIAFEPNEWDGSEIDRPLTGKGKKRVRLAAVVMASMQLIPTHLVSSPFARARETAAGLTDSRPKTHPEFRPAGATRCHSLPLAGHAILGSDLHEWLFLLVTACGRNASGLSL